ncbi:type II secretion system protein GspD [Chitinimonas arctica]|uniref:Type IV pilus biogenesis and competence protein PilQ n=1 Tax=Chitinimonas arctica TaxID=2594795 RepID=A0A516SBJ7_9NEIS|nr:type II secretion system secretin GspD [Chitinimonas arctica]QDQ25519.1 type II secretion system protein GspD [Chitinimonas arctica]
MKKIKTIALALMLAGQVMAADDKVMLNFVNSDIDSTVKAVGLISGKNFVLDQRVKGTINIVSSSPVRKSEVYEILLSALRLQGFSVVETPTSVRIVPEADAKQNFGATVSKKFNVGGDRIVTQVYPLKYESAAQLVPILRPLITPNNSIAAYPGSNMLVITDYADNVKRLNQIIGNIDQPSAGDMVTLPLKYASAVDVAQMIGRLMPEVSVSGVASGGIPGAQFEGIRKTVVVADLRANALLIRGDNATSLAQIRQLADTLDKQGANGGNIHVIYLRNAEAPKLAATLKAILTGTDVAATPGSTFTSVSSTNNSGQTPAAIPSSAPSSGGGGQISPGVAIQADPTTNALIVTAPDNVYNNIRAVIDKLDVRRAQVYVEAMIAEVLIDKGGDFGVQWLVGGGNKSVNAVGIGNIGTKDNNLGSIIAGIANKTGIPAGFTLGLINGSVDGTGKKPNLAMIATAIEASGEGNVLSTPNLLTLDNEEASIVVGQDLPIVTGKQAATLAGQNPFNTIERKEVGIKLKIKPQVSEGGAITLQVSQEVSSAAPTVDTSGNGVAINTRKIDSKVLVDDGQVIVLGGLIETKVSQTDNRVPLLSSIPLIGNLFRFEHRESKRTNLMVFLRPVILRDGVSAGALSGERYQQLRDAQGAYKMDSRWMLPDLPKVQLPAIDLRRPSSASVPIAAHGSTDKIGVADQAAPVAPAEPMPQAEPVPAADPQPAADKTAVTVKTLGKP